VYNDSDTLKGSIGHDFSVPWTDYPLKSSKHLSFYSTRDFSSQ